jgi:2,4-dienoyl-CoA reductase-like NADH-dependent reductase (Old Yellow Enzyme family)
MGFPLAVVAEVKRVAQLHAKGPFALGYRISVEEPDADGLRIDDSLVLIDRLIAAKVDYVHVSLGSVLENKPIGSSGSETIAQIVLKRVDGRLPVFAAGQILVPAQADAALALGLTGVAVGRGLIINPNWVELARAEHDANVDTTLDPADVSYLKIPGKLWGIIEAMTGWFALAPRTAAVAE